MRRRKAKLFARRRTWREETREKRKRGEVEDDDVMKRAKSSSIGQVSAELTIKIFEETGTLRTEEEER